MIEESTRMSSIRRSRSAVLGAVLTAGSLALSTAAAVAVTGGTPVADSDTTHAYTAQITVGAHDRGCSAVLVDAEWLWPRTRFVPSAATVTALPLCTPVSV